MKNNKTFAACAALVLLSTAAGAAEWSDTAISWRYGETFREPFNPNNISKHIVALTHASGYKYGSNFFNADVLLSDSRDPGFDTTAGAQEIYVLYRNTVDAGKVAGRDFKAGVVRGWGVTGGFDLNSKNDAYGSKKRMLVLGPTLMLDVPGFLNLSLLALFESNAPRGVDRYTYKTHAAFEADWSTPLPVPAVPLAFEGYALHIASKGANEFGGPTAPETHLDMKLMADVGAVTGIGKNTFKVGIGYEYWRNKFGNPTTPPGQGAGPGATAKTPMVRAEYHF
jgi:hypothetical protein